MIINRLQLTDFRNYKNMDIQFHKGLNVFIGSNAQGKTNILEAIYLCATGRSFRTPRDHELVSWGKNHFRIKLDVKRSSSYLNIDFSYTDKHKKIKINGLDKRKLSELIGEVKVVLFAPEHLQLVKGGPGERRKFIDILISQLSPIYFHSLQQYYKILLQRNNLLKMGLSNTEQIEMQLEIWDNQLAEVGSKIIVKRLEVVNNIKSLASGLHHKITEAKENLELTYKSFFDSSQIESNQEIFDEFTKALRKSIRNDICRGYTSIGPHRDDLTLLLDGNEAKNFGSQGQQRSIVLSLKLAELALIRQETDELPVLLLDDVMSELDEERSNFLLSSISEDTQTFITATHLRSLHDFDQKNYKLYQVRDGQIS